jgi:hypothetical protein
MANQHGIENTSGTEQKGERVAESALSHSVAQAIIAGSGLPAASQERLSGGSYPSPEEVREAISAERSYLARLQEGSVVQIGGSAPRSPHISMGLTGLEQVEKAMEALISGTQAAGRGRASLGDTGSLRAPVRGLRDDRAVPPRAGEPGERDLRHHACAGR